MPRSLDPNSKLRMVLASDLDKMPTPTILANAPTLNMQRRLVGLMQSLNGNDMASMFDAILDAGAACICGWENIPIDYSREALGDVLSLDELVEVFGFLIQATVPTADDKKKSDLPH